MTRREEMLALAAVLRSRGRNNSQHDVERAADMLDRLSQAEPGYVAVPQGALDWLFGEGPDADGKWFGETIGDGLPKIAGKYPRTYWWRSKFRTMIEAALPAPATASAGWQPIETAPKDVEIIYLNRFGEIGFCHWSEALHPDQESVWWDEQKCDECVPRYWLPRACLPAAPTKRSAM